MSVIEVTQETLIRQPNPLETLEGHQLLGHIISMGGVELGMGCNEEDAVDSGALLRTIVDRLGPLRRIVRIDVAQQDDNPESLIVSIRHDESDSDRKLF